MQLFDTATKTLTPVDPPDGHIGMYFCGPTVYARAHAGNARPFVLGMWLSRWLRASGRSVTFVHNITDINDKIYLAARTRAQASPTPRRDGIWRTSPRWGWACRTTCPV
jgi:cysteinyl-tRNA synthetase